jgi:hypothetical protein
MIIRLTALRALLNEAASCQDYISVVTDERMSMEHRWNDTDRGKPKFSATNLSQCHFVHHKSHLGIYETEPAPTPERPATNRLSHGTGHNRPI